MQMLDELNELVWSLCAIFTLNLQGSKFNNTEMLYF